MRGSGERSQSSRAEAEALEGGLSRAERRGCRQRANARTVGGGHRPFLTWQPLLVMKADHHDVQDGPPWGAIAAPPDLMDERREARTTMTSTAEGGKLGDPAIPRRTARGGFQVSAREPHEGHARGSREEADDPAALPPPGRGRAPSSASAVSGLSPDAGAAAGEAGLGRTGRDLTGLGLMAGRGLGERGEKGAG